MNEIIKQVIDWTKTAKNLQFLRSTNMELRRYVCYKLKFDNKKCSGGCETCKFDIDKHISQSELAKVFDVSESMIANWENNKSRPAIEDLIYYSKICKIKLEDVIVYENNNNKKTYL